LKIFKYKKQEYVQKFENSLHSGKKPGRCKKWYIDLLQIQPLFDTPFFVLFRIGQSELIITCQQGSLSDYVQNGVVYWEVETF
jgi:hypothetical protein